VSKYQGLSPRLSFHFRPLPPWYLVVAVCGIALRRRKAALNMGPGQFRRCTRRSPFTNTGPGPTSPSSERGELQTTGATQLCSTLGMKEEEDCGEASAHGCAEQQRGSTAPRTPTLPHFYCQSLCLDPLSLPLLRQHHLPPAGTIENLNFYSCPAAATATEGGEPPSIE
jgi:hypothetical protein